MKQLTIQIIAFFVIFLMILSWLPISLLTMPIWLICFVIPQMILISNLEMEGNYRDRISPLQCYTRNFFKGFSICMILPYLPIIYYCFGPIYEERMKVSVPNFCPKDPENVNPFRYLPVHKPADPNMVG